MFQKSVLKNIKQDEGLIAPKWVKYQKYVDKIDFIEDVKEEKYQEGFLRDIFENCLGYTLDTTDPNDFNLEREKKNETNSKKADGVIYVDNKVIGVIELKGQDTKNLDKVESQAFEYLTSHTFARYVIISNFDELRFYIDKKTAYEEFSLFRLNYEEFKKLHLLLSYESIKENVPLKLKERSVSFEQEISKELYRDFSSFRTQLFDNIVVHNKEKEPDKSQLLRLTQKLCDRIVFILFAEDRGLLSPNTIQEIREEFTNQKLTDYSLYGIYKIYFDGINKGNQKLNIPKYNGGLFAEDETLNSLIIDDDALDLKAQALSNYDFESDVSVNILGHIFEQSLTDLEEMSAKINNIDFDKTKTKRKKDGIFYTPEYITKYIVDNTLGKLCSDKREELNIIDVSAPNNSRILTKKEQKVMCNLEEYRKWLFNLKILDPACGSGAFLNQALDFLIFEHKNLQRELVVMGDITAYYEIEKSILEHNLYGVDINEDAVEIARLSLWLRTAHKGRELTKLVDKIKCGNSLIDDKSVTDDAFVWEEEFSEVFENGGFDVVIGNPPYVRHEYITKMKPALEKYVSYAGTADLFVYFFELASNLLKEKGLNGYICSNKFFNATYAKNLRKYILENIKIEQIIDFEGKQVFSDAIVESTVTIFEKSSAGKEHSFTVLNADLIESYKMKQSDLDIDSFTLLNPRSILLKHKIEKMGVPLKNWDINIKSGIKTGYNEAYIIDGNKKDELIKKDEKNTEVIKPILRGRDIARYGYEFADKWLINIHNNPPVNINQYPTLKIYFDEYIEKLKKRSDKGETPYNLRNCAYLNDFQKDKIIWLELTDDPKFVLDKSQYLLEMTVFFIVGDKLNYLLALLNSKAVFWYFDLICSESGVGTNRWKKTYVEQLPIPVISKGAEELFIEEAELIMDLNKTLQAKKTKFLTRITSNFGFAKLSKRLEAFYETDFKTFFEELKKKKIILTLKEQDEWEEYFQTYKRELLELKAKIDVTNKKIDTMVYKLYGLTDDEIKIIEGVS